MEKIEVESKGIDMKGKIFIRRFQEALKDYENVSIQESLEKVEEMRDLMITLAKMLRYATQQINQHEEEKAILTYENKTLVDLLNKMELHVSKAEENLSKFTEKCRQFEDFKDKYDQLKTDLDVIRKHETESEISLKDELCLKLAKSKKTQTDSANNALALRESFSRFEGGDLAFDSYCLHSGLYSSEIDVSLQKLQSFLLHKEKKWHQTSGREREQRVKIGRLMKQIKILQNQLDWKNNQLNFKEAEIKEKKIELVDAEKRIVELKKVIKTNKK